MWIDELARHRREWVRPDVLDAQPAERGL
jgi:hypothetical protein